jgi:hypothetical protein
MHRILAPHRERSGFDEPEDNAGACVTDHEGEAACTEPRVQRPGPIRKRTGEQVSRVVWSQGGLQRWIRVLAGGGGSYRADRGSKSVDRAARATRFAARRSRSKHR